MTYKRAILLLSALAVAASVAIASSETLYDEEANARKQIAAGIAEASRSGKNVVLVFGANW